MNKKMISYILTLAVLIVASAQLMYAHPVKRPAKSVSQTRHVKTVKPQDKMNTMTWREAAKMATRASLRSLIEEEEAGAGCMFCHCGLSGSGSHWIFCLGNGNDCHLHAGTPCMGQCTIPD